MCVCVCMRVTNQILATIEHVSTSFDDAPRFP